MEWLSQNWIWIVLAVGAFWLFSRTRHGGLMGGCGHGMAHEGQHDTRQQQGPDSPRSPVKAAADQAAQGAAPSHRHRSGCC